VWVKKRHFSGTAVLNLTPEGKMASHEEERLPEKKEGFPETLTQPKKGKGRGR